MKVRDKAALLKVDGLRGANPAELTILTRLGEPLLAQPAIREFIGRAQEQAREDPSFKVATRIGLRDGVFVLPDGPVPEGRSTVELSLDPRYAGVSPEISLRRDSRAAGKRWSACAAGKLGRSPSSP